MRRPLVRPIVETELVRSFVITTRERRSPVATSAYLGEGARWPTSLALTEPAAAEAARIGKLGESAVR